MATRHPNYRLAKIHRNYTVEEIAKLFGFHRNTVREWVKRGLPTSDRKRSMLILGPVLAAFIPARRLKNKRVGSKNQNEIFPHRDRSRNPASYF